METINTQRKCICHKITKFEVEYVRESALGGIVKWWTRLSSKKIGEEFILELDFPINNVAHLKLIDSDKKVLWEK